MVQQLHNTNEAFNTPPQPSSQFNLTLLQKLVAIYKLWHDVLPHFPKSSKYTLGQKIDSGFLENIENVAKASYATKTEKLIFLKRASVALDMVKFFLQVSWEIKSLNDKKYILLSEKIGEAGKMLGGWIKSLN